MASPRKVALSYHGANRTIVLATLVATMLLGISAQSSTEGACSRRIQGEGEESTLVILKPDAVHFSRPMPHHTFMLLFSLLLPALLLDFTPRQGWTLQMMGRAHVLSGITGTRWRGHLTV
jgi:hypothetical protein